MRQGFKKRRFELSDRMSMRRKGKVIKQQICGRRGFINDYKSTDGRDK